MLPDNLKRDGDPELQADDPVFRARGGISSDKSIDDAMVERAALALCDEGILALSGKPATWERHADGFRELARAALVAALSESRGLNGDD